MRLQKLLPSSWMLLFLVRTEKVSGNNSYFFFPFSPCKHKAVTWQRTAEDLRSHADVAAAEPGARVDSDVSGNHRSWEDVPDWNFLFPVASEDLLRQTHSTRW